jgi:hypothetical protein
MVAAHVTKDLVVVHDLVFPMAHLVKWTWRKFRTPTCDSVDITGAGPAPFICVQALVHTLW